MGDFLLGDLKSAFRTIGRNRAFSAIAVCTMALGIAGTTIVFSLVNSILLRPLAYRDPGRLVSITEIVPELSKLYPRLPVNARHFDLWRKQCSSFAQMSLIIPESDVLSRAGEPTKIATARVSASFFDLLGARLQLGRNFVDQEDRFGAPRVAIITDRLWAGRFNRDRAMLGRPLYLDGRATILIGVLAPDFRPPVLRSSGLVSASGDTDVFLPAALNLSDIGLEGDLNYAAVARLKPGVTVAQARAELNVVQAQIAKQLHGSMHLAAGVSPLTEEVTGGVRTGLIALLCAIGAVFLIICVNLANLSLARGVAQHRENAIRQALGAGRWETIRRTITESVVTSLIGGVFGIALAYAGLRILLHYAPVDLPRLDEIAIDGRVLAFAVALAALAGALFGSLPAWQSSKADPQDALRSGSHTLTGDRSGARVRDALIGLEVGLGAVLTIAAGLLVMSFIRLLHVDKGFQTENLIAATVNLPEASYQKSQDRESFYRKLLAHLQSVPGATSAALVSQLPLNGETWIDDVIRQRNSESLFQQPTANYRFISPGYFRTMGIPILRGRVFEDSDRQRNPAVISQKVANRVWPGENPIGKKFWRGDPDEPPLEIVGVAADVRAGIAQDPPMTVYTPYWYRNRTAITLVVRTPLSAAAMVPGVRAAVGSVNPEAAISDVRTMDQVLSDSVAERRFEMYLVGGFAVFALLLATLGIFGVVSWTVARRKNEIGIRMALGATAGDVRRLMVAQGMRAVVAGLTIGVAAALALGRALSNLLFGVSARDPLVFLSVIAFLAAVSLAACYVPALGATRANPVDVLRNE